MERFLFGDVHFGESEEYSAFQYRFLIVLMLGSIVFAMLFVGAALLDAHPLPAGHLAALLAYLPVTIGLLLLLRGACQRRLAVTLCHYAATLALFLSALLQVPWNELRVLWFYTAIPSAYILLGCRAGLLVTSSLVLGFALVNPRLAQPYSRHALVTGIVVLVFLGFFFHVYVDRSIAYFQRMREAIERLRQLSQHDTLTGALNARAYYEQGDRLILASRRVGQPCSLLFVDLDHFKAVNDTLGHAAGDAVLRAVAERITATVRRSDLVGRIGGEEFSVLLPHTDAGQALVLAEKLRAAVEAMPTPIAGRALRVTASIGVSIGREADESILEIQQRADRAMYQAKAMGRNRVTLFDAMQVWAHGPPTPAGMAGPNG
ncbi:GGDEF domain-containing protein [Leptothrix discophora]|uniref:diguanylate cyclase n=1 Tax=Leptothrix discophora TaxID=89 RepID=A0ABT9G2G1_LEPDI|nr:GGDEF domain-containing protein [Leptothrix discophora]MDP4300676.1 GGDEF domain-containing protein [Leptothrix discophora]